MEQSILHFYAEACKKFFDRLQNGEIADMEKMAESLLEDLKDLTCKLMSVVLEAANLEIRKDKDLQKELGLLMQEHDRIRSLLTSIGRIDYARDYYKEKESGGYFYPLDEMTSVEAYQRIGHNIAAKIVNATTKVSYQRAVDSVTGGSVSRQTAKNKIKEVGILEKAAPKDKSECKVLHVYADEDHAHIQDKKRRSNATKSRGKRVPYVVISEGIREECRNRRATINATHFADKDLKSAVLWDSVAGYVNEAYEVSEGSKIYIHGDGASWIKTGCDVLPKAVPVMDGYHFEKELKRISRIFPNKNIRNRVREMISKNDERGFKELMDSLVADASVSDAKKGLGSKKYILDQFEPIRNLLTLKIPGSCTEGQISHGLSERLSRDPMGWSKEGVGRMAMLRAYTNNGCKVEASDFRRIETMKEKSILQEYAENIYTHAVEGAVDWSLFEKEAFTMDKASGTQILINAYGENYGSALIN